jgi:hypothetical protein
LGNTATPATILLAQQFGRAPDRRRWLVAPCRGRPECTRLALAPVDDEQAIVRGLGRGRGDTVHARQESAHTVLTTSGMRFVRQVGA